MKRKAMDLSFGADVEAIGGLQSPLFRTADGQVFEFKTLAGHAPDFPRLLATGMSLIQSKNERAFSRKNTNATIFNSLSKFSTWASLNPAIPMSVEGLTKFRDHLFATLAPTTAYSVYTVVARICSALIEAGHLSKFQTPENASRTAVASSASSSGASFATALDGAMNEKGADEANESIMKIWLNAAWTELDALFSRIDQGKAWRAEVAESWDIPPDFEAYLQLLQLDRTKALSICKTICVKHLEGQSPETLSVSKTDHASWTRSLQIIASRFGSRKEPKITRSDLEASIANASVCLVDIPAWAQRAPVGVYRATKTEYMRIIVQCLHRQFGGFPFDTSMALNFPGMPRTKWLDAVGFLINRVERGEKKIFVPEIASYFHPSPAMATLAMSILCAAQINPESVAHLKVGSLMDDPDNPNQARLSWEKGRAGGAQPALPFPKGSQGSRTIPRLWERFLEASGELRELAPERAKQKMFLWTTGNTGRGWLTFVPDDGDLGGTWRTTRTYLEGGINSAKPDARTVEILKPIALHVPKMSLALIRNTAINIASARLDRDFRSTAAMDGRKSSSALESAYLANAQTKDRLDQQIREGQEALASWLRTPPIVVPDEEAAVQAELSLDQSTARQLLAEELNNGMGASLLNGQAIFIDTPINALRITQWLEKLEEAKPAMLRDNPARWTTIYQPQISLYKEALHSFSRASRSAASTLGANIQLPFPPVY